VCLLPLPAPAAAQVHALRHGFEMVGIDARAVAAQMVDLQAVRNLTDEHLVDVPVSEPLLAGDDDAAISSAHPSAELPAASVGDLEGKKSALAAFVVALAPLERLTADPAAGRVGVGCEVSHLAATARTGR